MGLREQLDGLKPYPTLLYLLVANMNDEEYEQYADALTSDTDDRIVDISNESGGEARSVDYDLQPVAGSDTRTSTDVGSTLLALGDLLNDSALLDTWLDVIGIKESIHASLQLGVEWRNHLYANVQIEQIAAASRPAVTEDGNWASMARHEVNELIEQTIEVKEVDDLGPDLISVILGGPRRTTFLFSSDALAEVTDVERDFLLYHMISHFLIPGHLPKNAFSIRLEYKRGHIPQGLYTCVDRRCRYLGGVRLQEEGEADDGATCSQAAEYVTSNELSPLSRKMARGALQHGVSVRQLRALIRERERKQDRLFKFAAHAGAALRERNLERFLAPPLNYRGTLRVVRPRDDRHVYVTGCVKGEKSWKRWICSSKVLTRLGLEIGDVEVIPAGALQDYEDKGPLLDPAEVDQLHTVLSDSLPKRQKVSLTPELAVR